MIISAIRYIFRDRIEARQSKLCGEAILRELDGDLDLSKSCRTEIADRLSCHWDKSYICIIYDLMSLCAGRTEMLDADIDYSTELLIISGDGQGKAESIWMYVPWLSVQKLRDRILASRGYKTLINDSEEYLAFLSLMENGDILSIGMSTPVIGGNREKQESAQQVDSAEASTNAVPPSNPSGSPR